MKVLRNIIICLSLVLVAGCETYDDYKIEYSSIYPLSGEWLVRFTDPSLAANNTSGIFVLSTFNTADKSKTEMWIRATSTSATAANAAYVGRFTGKINCSVEGLTFSGENVLNTYYLPPAVAQNFTITEGSIVIDGYDTATGGKSDKITFTITDTRKPGKVITVTGFRRTRWLDDEI